jgi:hypothetical protein
MKEQASALAQVDLRDIAATRLEAFVEGNAQLQNTSPLSDLATSTQFLSALYFKPYDEFEAFADDLLEARGALKIPFDTKTGTAELEIDLTEKRLKARSLPLVRFTKYKDDDWVTTLIPFDLTFDQITKISQKSKFVNVSSPYSSVATPLLTTRNCYFLKLDPEGQIGTPILFNDFTQTMGQREAQLVMNNFGRYIVHLLEKEQVEVKAKLTSVLPGGGGSGTKFARAINDLASGNFQFTVGSEQPHKKEILSKHKQMELDTQGWNERLADQAFDAILNESFSELEVLLELR